MAPPALRGVNVSRQTPFRSIVRKGELATSLAVVRVWSTTIFFRPILLMDEFSSALRSEVVSTVLVSASAATVAPARAPKPLASASATCAVRPGTQICPTSSTTPRNTSPHATAQHCLGDL
jgi:hypothetical protein